MDIVLFVDISPSEGLRTIMNKSSVLWINHLSLSLSLWSHVSCSKPQNVPLDACLISHKEQPQINTSGYVEKIIWNKKNNEQEHVRCINSTDILDKLVLTTAQFDEDIDRALHTFVTCLIT